MFRTIHKTFVILLKNGFGFAANDKAKRRLSERGSGGRRFLRQNSLDLPLGGRCMVVFQREI